jgi:acyl-lipid omega-6 desaturase (Delta-12 desaturase)
VQLPVIFLASIFGVWIFYIHHQFDNVYWAHTKNCDRIKAAISGSSFYQFPEFLSWFTGHIEYHHIHHLNFRIPNYRLHKCFEDIEELHKMIPRTFKDGLRVAWLALWDEATGKLISFTEYKRMNQGRAAAK